MKNIAIILVFLCFYPCYKGYACDLHESTDTLLYIRGSSVIYNCDLFLVRDNCKFRIKLTPLSGTF